jgi:hypothetical protein
MCFDCSWCSAKNITRLSPPKGNEIGQIYIYTREIKTFIVEASLTQFDTDTLPLLLYRERERERERKPLELN